MVHWVILRGWRRLRVSSYGLSLVIFFNYSVFEDFSRSGPILADIKLLDSFDVFGLEFVPSENNVLPHNLAQRGVHTWGWAVRRSI